jgi:hypothetical protein
MTRLVKDQTMNIYDVHLIGSIPLRDARDVFTNTPSQCYVARPSLLTLQRTAG